ncbi:MAG TPA: nitroreductase family protein [bacterium]|nr:nitroreductase family protein [bacterium]HPN42814.1 nitroreductase family protein [bacterium]
MNNTRLLTKKSWTLVVCFIIGFTLNAGAAIGPGETFHFGNYNWVNAGKPAEISSYLGQEALKIQPDKGDAVALIQDIQFENGVIELDIAAIPTFTGLVFRARNNDIYEGIYFRPQNSRADNPVQRARTVQYISAPRHSWFYLRDKYPGKYEGAVDLAPDAWFHVKVVVRDSTASVFVNNAATPCLVVNDLKHGISAGFVGVWCGNGSGGTFANIKIKPEPFTAAVKQFAATGGNFTKEQDYLFDVFKNRRSVRKFKSTPVPDEHILKILDIARTAPTSGNQQPWKFLVIQDRDKITALKEATVNSYLERIKAGGVTDAAKLDEMRTRYSQVVSDYLSAPVYISVLVDSASTYPSYNIYDGSLAAGYLMIAARALGYGTVFTQDSFPFPVVKQVFNIPDNYAQICFTPIGIPENWPQTPKKRPLDEFAVFEQFAEEINYFPPAQHKQIEVNTTVLEQYIGEYEINPQFIIKVSLQNEQLYIQATGQPQVEIYPESEEKFFLKVVDAQILFQKQEGKVTGLILYQSNQQVPAKKIK